MCENIIDNYTKLNKRKFKYNNYNIIHTILGNYLEISITGNHFFVKFEFCRMSTCASKYF